MRVEPNSEDVHDLSYMKKEATLMSARNSVMEAECGMVEGPITESAFIGTYFMTGNLY
jgi:hypothetical protein